MAPHRRLFARWAALGGADRRNLAVLAGVAAAIRLILVLAYSPVFTSDSQSYLDLAHRLEALHLHGSSGARTPGYPILLLAVRYSAVATWCVQAAIGVLATLLVYGLVRRLGGGTRIALVAGLLYALDLEVLAIEHMIMTETLTSFLLLLAAHGAVTIADADNPRRRTLIGLGVILACLCLVRPDELAVTLYLVLALGLALTASLRATQRTGARRTSGLRRALWILVPPLVAVAAWTGVNRATLGVSSLSTVLGFNMIDHVVTYVQVEPGSDHAITAAYVAARTRRETQHRILNNLSYEALPAMERVAHLDAPHLSGRLLGIALGVVEHHPAQYVASSLKQWPRFWLAPNYADRFATGRAARAIRLVWTLERIVLTLINVAFVLLLLSDLARRTWRREPFLRRSSLIIAGVAAVGLIMATFFAYGDTGRYGYVYFPLVLSVCAASYELLACRLYHRQVGAATVRARTTLIR